MRRPRRFCVPLADPCAALLLLACPAQLLGLRVALWPAPVLPPALQLALPFAHALSFAPALPLTLNGADAEPVTGAEPEALRMCCSAALGLGPLDIEVVS